MSNNKWLAAFGKIFIFICCLSIICAKITVTSYVDRSEITFGETLTYVISIETNSNKSPGRIGLPKLKDFNVQGSSSYSSISMVNNSFSKKMETKYSLYPKKMGKLSIPVLTLKIDDKTYNTNLHVIEVKKEGTQEKNQTSETAPLFLLAKTNKNSYYLGEPVLYNLKIFNRRQLFSPSFKTPQLSNLIESGLKPLESSYQKEVNGRNYSITELKFLYFPEKIGEALVGPGKIIFSRSFFEPDQQVKSNTVSLKIKQLPANVPETVGSFNISAKINQTKAIINDGLTLTITISGIGNLRKIGLTLPNLPGDLELFEPKDNLSELLTTDGLKSIKTFEYLLIPRSRGSFTIPSIRLSFFNPNQHKIKMIKTKPLKLYIKSNGNTRKTINNGLSGAIMPIQNDVNSNNDIHFLISKQGFDYYKIKVVIYGFIALNLAIILLPLLILPTILLLKRTFIKKEDRSLLNDLNKLKNMPDNFYEELHSSLIKYIASKNNLKLGQLDRITLTNILPQDILEFITSLEQEKYSPNKTKEHELRDLKKAYSIIKRLKKKIKRGKLNA